MLVQFNYVFMVHLSAVFVLEFNLLYARCLVFISLNQCNKGFSMLLIYFLFSLEGIVNWTR